MGRRRIGSQAPSPPLYSEASTFASLSRCPDRGRRLASRLLHSSSARAKIPIALALTAVYTLFLPRLFPASGAKPRDLARAYTTELAGFAAGFVIVGAFPRWTLTSFALVYGTVLVFVAWSAGLGRRAATTWSLS